MNEPIESINKNEIRIGRFTSSKIFELMKSGKGESGFGATAITYIDKKRRERRMGRPLEIEKYSRSMAWGKFMESRVHELLGIAYESVGDITLPHPTNEYWAGSPDLKIMRESIVADIKCYEPDNFSWYVDSLTKANGDTEIFKKECPEEFWQLVSNAIILGVENIRAVVYMPYFSELSIVRDMASSYEGHDQWKYRFIEESDYTELPYLPDGGHYKNLNVFTFKVKEEDKQALTERVESAVKLLIGKI